MTEPESRDHDDDLNDDEDGGEGSPPRPKAKSKSASSSAMKPVAARKPAGVGTQVLAVGLIALALGGVGGWFGHVQKTKAALRADTAATPVGSGVPPGPCGAWHAKICASTGAQSAPCQQAKGALDLLLPATCEVALGSMPATLARLKAARSSCDRLVHKICTDLPPQSKVCDMVKERTPSFPTERCAQMMQNYDKVITELKQMDLHDRPEAEQLKAAQQMPGGGMPPAGMPGGMPGGMPPVSTPHAPPHP